jgi:phage terminase large subunit
MSEIEIPAKCEFLFEPHRYKVMYGGRGGGKSHSISKALLAIGAKEKHRIVCTREFQVSIRDSVHKLLSDQIDMLGLSNIYSITQNQIIGKNGTEFIFAGLKHNISSIKSMEGISIVWVEEAQTVSDESWKILIPTIRKDGSEIWISMNPDQETDPAYKRFIKNPPPDSMVIEIGWKDNPFFPEVLRQEKDYLYRVDTDAAEHIWGGKTRKHSVASVLSGKYIVESFDHGEKWNGPYYGADWGFANDPTAIVLCWVNGGNLYIEHEAYAVGVETVDIPKLFEKVPN